MKNKLLSIMFGCTLLLVGACTPNNGSAVANEHPDGRELSSSLPMVEYIADTRGSYLQRYVDCEANVTLYIQSKGITAVPNTSINQDFVNKHCKGN